MSRRRAFRSSQSPRGRCFEYARIEPGQAILVRGAAGSVGACATQMAKVAGATVYGTAHARDVERVRALGAAPVVEGDHIGAQLASQPLDAVIDTIGGDALESTCEAGWRASQARKNRDQRRRLTAAPR